MTDAEKSEVIELAWCDETSFDAIKAQTGLSEGEVIDLMRRELKSGSYRLWRRRVSGRKTKHPARDAATTRGRYPDEIERP